MKKKIIMNKSKEEKKCEYCGKVFLTYSCRDRKFCSRDCYYNFKKENIQCLICGKIFNPDKNHQFGKCCSLSCKKQLIDKFKEEKKCEYCGKLFISWRNRKARFCSKNCCYNFQREDKVCPACGKIFNSDKNHQFGKCCSLSCRKQLRGHFKEEKECEYCGKLFIDWKYKKSKFCSKKCKYQITREDKKCPTCGKIFNVNKGYKMGSYCSQECWYKDFYIIKYKECVICGKKTGHRRSYDADTLKTCGKECRAELKRRQNTGYNDEYNNSLHEKENDLSKEKYKYDRFLIKYPMSPTGRAYIGLAKSPLTINNNGIGFKGVKLQSENRELIQCYECGKWYRYITDRHLNKHGLTTNEYKLKYGFNITTGLISDIKSKHMSDVMLKNWNDGLINRELIINNIRNIGRGKKGHKQSIEAQNNKGTCDEQLKAKVVNFIHRFNKLPSYSNQKYCESFNSFINRFGDGKLERALYAIGLPIRIDGNKSRRYPTYKFSDGYVHEFIKDKYVDNWKIMYELMKEKCSILSKY